MIREYLTFFIQPNFIAIVLLVYVFHVSFSRPSRVFWLAFGSLQVHFPGSLHSFTSCQLLLKGCALSTG